MKTIWKFPLAVMDRQRVLMPKGTEILTVQRQSEQACIWAIVDDQAEMETRAFDIYGTGNPMPELAMGDARKYVGTFQAPPFVWHVFEIV